MVSLAVFDTGKHFKAAPLDTERPFIFGMTVRELKQCSVGLCPRRTRRTLTGA